MKDQCLTSGDPTHISEDMVEKGLERESDEVIVGENRRTETIYAKASKEGVIDKLYKKGLYKEVCQEYISDLNEEIKEVREEIKNL